MEQLGFPKTIKLGEYEFKFLTELEVEREYQDILLVPKDLGKGYYTILIEFKYLKKDNPVPFMPEDILMPCLPKVTLSNLETNDNDAPFLLTFNIACLEIRNLLQYRHCTIII